MSVFTIFYKKKDGKDIKMMRPVKTKEEYLRLRDTEYNKKAEKMKLVQMNYSCLPNGDGTLAGSTRISNSVAMDVDFKVPSSLPEGKLPEDWLKEEKEKVREVILSKKDEVGLLMLEESFSKGYHLAFRRRKELSQEENLEWASKLLNVVFDKGAKDITRVFYTPSSEKLIYIKEELFDNEGYEEMPVAVSAPTTSAPNDELAGKKEAERNVHPSANEATPTSDIVYINESMEKAKPNNLRAFDLCVKEAGLSVDGMDIWGVHNWHTNLMSVLSVGLPKLMSKQQLEAVISERLPNYSQTKDCKRLVDDFCEKYTANVGYMNSTLREINAEAQKDTTSFVTSSNGENETAGLPASEEEEKAITKLNEGWIAPTLPKKLPRLMNLLVNNFDPRFRPMLLLSSLPVLAAHAAHFRARYLDGKVKGPQTFVAVIGKSGSGKGNTTDLYNSMIQYTLEASDEQEWEKVRENAEIRDIEANAKKKTAKYKPKLRLFETTSKSSIMDLQTNLGKNGMLLGQFSEVDGLSGGVRAGWSDISVLLRKGWDMDMQRQYYMSEATCNTYVRMSISLLMSGTVKAMLGRMFSDNNCENGFMQRCIPVIVPQTKRTFRPPVQNTLSDDEVRERDALLIELYQKDVALGEGTLLLELPKMNDAIGKWFDSLEELYNNGQLSEAEADLSHRCGEFMFRAAIPLVALYGEETKEIVNFCLWVGEMAYYTMCHIFGQRVQQDITSADKLLSERMDGRKTAEPILEKMPNMFTTKQFKEMRLQAGQSTDVKMLLNRYCKSGKLVKTGRGVYCKAEAYGNIISVTKTTDPID